MHITTTGKKVITFLLCLAMLVLMAAGCAQGSTTSPGTSQSTTGAATTAAEKPLVTIKMMQNWVTLDDQEGIAKDRIKLELEKEFNIKLEIISPAEGYYDKLNTYLSTGEAPDIINDAFDATFVVKAAEGELLYDMGAAVAANASAYPTLAKIFADPMQKFLNDVKFSNPDSNLAIWSMSNIRNPWAGAVVYNGKILSSLGLEQPTTVEEYIQLLKDIKAKDSSLIPMGARIDKGNLIGILSPVFFRTYGVDPLELTLDGDTYTDTSLGETAKECWIQLQGLYKDGLIDPEIITNELQTVYDRFNSGKYATLVTNQPGSNGGGFSWLYNEFIKVNPDAKPGVDLLIDQQPLTGPDGVANVILPELDVCGTNTVIFGNSEVADRALELLNYLLSDEGQDLKWFGIEGIHYTVDASGNYVRNAEEMLKETMIYNPGDTVRLEWTPFSDLTAQLYFQFDSAKDIKDALDKAVPIINNFYVEDNAVGQYGVPVGQAFEKVAELTPVYATLANNNFTDEENTVKSKVEDIKKQWYAAFLVGQKDVAAEWDNFVQAVKDAGGDDLIAYKTSHLDEIKAIYDEYYP